VSAGGALLLAATVVWHSAYAGFTDVTASRAMPTITTGTLALTDDDAAVRMFNATGLKPGGTTTSCVAVTSTGSAATVRLYGTGRSTTNGLAGQLRLTVEVGTGGSSKGCGAFRPSATVYDGTVADFPTDSYAAGVGPWTTTGGTSTTRVYRIVSLLPKNAPNSVQNGNATLTFVWEARTK
jgi:hypothetical protein